MLAGIDAGLALCRSCSQRVAVGPLYLPGRQPLVPC